MFVAGVRQEEDLYVRLIDSVTKAVSVLVLTFILCFCLAKPNEMLLNFSFIIKLKKYCIE